MCVVVRAGAPAAVVELLGGSCHARVATTVLISVSLYAGRDGWCGPSLVAFVLAWEEAVQEPDAMAFVLPVRALRAAKRTRCVAGSMVKIGVRSVQGLLVRRWGSAVGDICRRCRPLGLVGLLSSAAWTVTCCAAEGTVGSGVGRSPTSWSLAAAAVSERSVARSLQPGRVGRRGPAGGGRAAGLRSFADRTGVSFLWVVCAGSASGRCVTHASGARGPSGTVGAGGPSLCLVLLGLGELGFR